MHRTWDGPRFQRLLRRLMNDTGLTQQDIASMAGISRPQVSRWMSGAHRPGFDALQDLAAALRASHPRFDGSVGALLEAAGYEPGPASGTPAGAAPEDPLADLTPEERTIARAFIETLRRTAEDRARTGQRPA